VRIIEWGIELFNRFSSSAVAKGLFEIEVKYSRRGNE
jgi:hypothetical protein